MDRSLRGSGHLLSSMVTDAKRMGPLVSLLLSILLICVTPLTAQEALRARPIPLPPPVVPPNILLILADDLGYGDLGSYGATKQDTPRLDELAAGGARFTDFYMSAPVCSPSRASILTGCYHKRVGVNNVLWPVSVAGLDPDEITIAEVLQTRGYATRYYGKWHVGDQKAFLPVHQGFDSFHGIPYSHDMRSLVRLKKEKEKLSPLHLRVLPLVRDDKVEGLIRDVSPLMTAYQEETIAFMTQCASEGRPFFVEIAHHAVHLPNEPEAAFLGKSNNGRYGDWVEQMDASTGHLIDALYALGIEKNTLIIFTSDNGPSKRGGGSAGPLRGFKHSTWEGGLRVPFIVWWPGRIPPGQVRRELGASPDILPTLASISGATLSEPWDIDGVDLSPLFLAAESDTAPPVPPRNRFVYYDAKRLMAVREGPWKLHLKTPEDRKNVLYNLEEDIGETTDIADRHPEIVAALLDVAEATRQELGDGRQNGFGERKEGRVSRLSPLFKAVSHPKEGSDDAR